MRVLVWRMKYLKSDKESHSNPAWDQPAESSHSLLQFPFFLLPPNNGDIHLHKNLFHKGKIPIHSILLRVFPSLSRWLPRTCGAAKASRHLLLFRCDLRGLCRNCWNWRRKKWIPSATKEKLSFFFSLPLSRARPADPYRRPAGSRSTAVVAVDPAEAKATAAAAISNLTSHFPPSRQVWTKDPENCHCSVSRTAHWHGNETPFAHYANRIDSISNAFIRVITPKVRKKKKSSLTGAPLKLDATQRLATP